MQLLGDDGETIVRKAIEMAKAGDPVALRLCIERVVPVQRGAVVELALPAIGKADDVRTACAAVIAAAAAGQISLAEAREFMALLDIFRKSIETEELSVRIQLLEQEIGR